jgi:hypothetical protein
VLSNLEHCGALAGARRPRPSWGDCVEKVDQHFSVEILCPISNKEKNYLFNDAASLESLFLKSVQICRAATFSTQSGNLRSSRRVGRTAAVGFEKRPLPTMGRWGLLRQALRLGLGLGSNAAERFWDRWRAHRGKSILFTVASAGELQAINDGAVRGLGI